MSILLHHITFLHHSIISLPHNVAVLPWCRLRLFSQCLLQPVKAPDLWSGFRILYQWSLCHSGNLPICYCKEMVRGVISYGDANQEVGQLCTLFGVKILEIKIRGGEGGGWEGELCESY